MSQVASIVTADQARGRATGALFYIGFGELWLLLGLRAAGGRHGVAQAFVLVVGLVLLAGVADLFRRAKTLPAGVRDAVEEERSRRMFRAVNIIQWVSVGTAVAILSILQLQEYIVTAISVIVGLHLLPLAGAFRNRQHYITGMLLVVWPLACLVLMPRTEVSGVTALGAGTVLLLSAAVALARMGGVWRAGGRQVVAVAERS